MAQSIKFYGGYGNLVADLTGSGLGFYGSNYGSPVPVGGFNLSTFITNSNGNATDSVRSNNITRTDPASGDVGSGDNRLLRNIPNQLATLNIRLISDTPVRTQNGQLWIYDRVDQTHPASGLNCYGAIIIHPWNTSPTPIGSGSTSWSLLGGSGNILNWGSFSSSISPASGGWSPSGSLSADYQHDFFCALSVQPTSIGSKPFACLFSVEFL